MIRGVAFSSLRRVSTLIHVLVLLGFAIAVAVVAPDATRARPAAPVGITNTPVSKGQWKLSYRYQRIHGRGLRNAADKEPGTTQIPFEMDTDIHTISVAHAPFERLTLVLRLPLVSHQMRQRDADNANMAYNTHSFGVGDLEVVGLVPFMKKGNEILDVHLGLRLPTARVNNKGKLNSTGARGQLPVWMQSGSGTTSILAGIDYQGYWHGFGWGVNGAGAVGFGENHRGYRLGNTSSFSGWLSHDVTSWLSGSLRLVYNHSYRMRQRRFSGPANHVASYGRSTGGVRLALAPGLSIDLPGLSGQRLSIEASWLVYQSLRGAQIDRDWKLSSGWEWIF